MRAQPCCTLCGKPGHYAASCTACVPLVRRWRDKMLEPCQICGAPLLPRERADHVCERISAIAWAGERRGDQFCVRMTAGR